MRKPAHRRRSVAQGEFASPGRQRATSQARAVYPSIAGGLRTFGSYRRMAPRTPNYQLMRPPGPASVSPDRRYVVWTSDRGQFHIWRMDIDEGNSGQITRGPGETFLQYSRRESGLQGLGCRACRFTLESIRCRSCRSHRRGQPGTVLQLTSLSGWLNEWIGDALWPLRHD